MKTHSVRISRARAPSARRRKWQTLAAVALITLTSASLVNAQGVTYTVNSTSDDVLGTDCTDRNGICTLRAAIQTANGHVGADTIDFNLPASSVINLTQALPDLSDSVGIIGAGPNLLTVRRHTGDNYRIFTVTTTGTVTISGLTISNGAGSNGGGIAKFNTGIVNVTNSTLSGNTASLGGGIFNDSGSTVNIINSTLSGNTSGSGGGVFNAATVNVINSTLSGNTATGGLGLGGGITNDGSSLVVTNSTVSGNSARRVGGISSIGGMAVKNSIIALNTASDSGPDVSGTFISQGFNLIGENGGAEASFPAGNPNANNDIVGTNASPVDPKLDPNGLQNNGGPTLTIALLLGSRAIDKGTSNGLTGQLTEDQRGTGFPRGFDDPAKPNANGGDGTDIGAFELQTAPPAVLANISTRLRVETGDNVLIGGFIITGTQPKKIIVRGIGPSLAQFFPDPLADPVLELYQGNTLLATNGNWKKNQAEVEATGLAPTNELESAIVQVVPPGNYTAIVRGVDNGTGIGVVEAYDLDLTVDSQLANISTRGLVQTGDNVLIAGTIVVGSPSRKVIVRAIGPSLPLVGTLADPTLELRDGNGNILQANDNWQESPNKQAIIDSGIPPTHDLESAIVATLPGNGASYTAIVRGVNATAGIAVVEVYALN